MIKIHILVIFILTGLTSCFGLFDSRTKELTHGYELTWIDSHDNRSIYKGEEQIAGYVSEVGYNENFIIAKQNPLIGDFYSKPNFKKTNYFIIDIKANMFNREGIIGPLTKLEFDKCLIELGINDEIKFEIVDE